MGDTLTLAFRDDQVFSEFIPDVIMVSFGLHDMEYDLMLCALKEMYRVLKRGDPRHSFYLS